MDMLVDLLKVGGVTGLSIGVLYLLYRQLLSLGIFPKLTRRQAFILLLIVIILVFLVVISAFLFSGEPGSPIVDASRTDAKEIHNEITTGDNSTSIIANDSEVSVRESEK